MTRLIVPLFIFALAAHAEPIGAIKACQAVPKLQHKLIARVAATDGKPAPEVWTVVAYDAKGPNGLREYTITAGTVVATRGISELVEKVAEADAIGLANIKLDSTQVAELAFAYADANAVVATVFDYDLRKDGEDAAPLWHVTARDDKGAQVGELVVAARTGTVVSHEGFALAPTPPDLKDAVVTPTAKPSSKRAATQEKPAVHRRIGGKLQKFFTGKDTISK
jgi:hypothetical protein